MRRYDHARAARLRPANPTLFERLIYAFIGIFSGALLSLLTLVPGCVLFFRGLDAETLASVWWIIWALPLAFCGALAVWGFFATNRMVETLAYWWECVTDRYAK